MKTWKFFMGSSFGFLRIFFLIVNLLVQALHTTSQVTSDGISSGNLDNSSNSNTASLQVPTTDLNLCSDTNNVSSTYCSCKDKVISCDFSSYPGSEKIKIAVHGQLMKASVKRLCLCNAPRNVLLDLREDLIPRQSNTSTGLHRVDLNNINGPLHFNRAFSLNFSGDLYMSNVSYLKSINYWEFGRGFDIQVDNVEDLHCCSIINVSQSYAKPTLYLDSLNIGTIYSNGINGIHPWKTVIFNAVTIVHEIQSYGIKLSSGAVNVSFTNCQFNNVDNYGIEIEKFENFVMSKSMINNSSPVSFMAVSNLLNSTLVITDNLFNNEMTWSLDANRVYCWYNMFDVWYQETFEFLNKTSFSDRVFSIEYNTIGTYLINETSNIPVLKPGDSVIFNENVFGKCNCSRLSSALLPHIISLNPSRCDFHKLDKDIRNGSCLINFESATSSCLKDASKLPQFSEMCNDPSISVLSFGYNHSNDNKLNSSRLDIHSTFINEMIKDTKFLFHIHQVSSHVETEEENAFAESTSISTPNSNHIEAPSGGASGHTALYVFVSLLGFIAVASIGGLIARRKRLTFYRLGQAPSESYDVLTTAT